MKQRLKQGPATERLILSRFLHERRVGSDVLVELRGELLQLLRRWFAGCGGGATLLDGQCNAIAVVPLGFGMGGESSPRHPCLLRRADRNWPAASGWHAHGHPWADLPWLRRFSIHKDRILITTTPYSSVGWLKELLWDPWNESKGTHELIDVIRFDSTENPAFPREEFERARATLPR